MALLEFDQAKSHLGQSNWQKVKFKENFKNIFTFTLPFFQVLFKRWINSKIHVILVIFASYFLLHSVSLVILSWTEHFNIMVRAAVKKSLRSPMAKQSHNLCLPESQEQYAICTFLWPVKLMLWINNLFLHLVESYIQTSRCHTKTLLGCWWSL